MTELLGIIHVCANDIMQKIPKVPVKYNFHHNAVIKLTGYHSSWHPGAFASKCVPSSRAFAQQKMPGGEPINADIPGARHLHQLAFKYENC